MSRSAGLMLGVATLLVEFEASCGGEPFLSDSDVVRDGDDEVSDEGHLVSDQVAPPASDAGEGLDEVIDGLGRAPDASLDALQGVETTADVAPNDSEIVDVDLHDERPMGCISLAIPCPSPTYPVQCCASGTCECCTIYTPCP